MKKLIKIMIAAILAMATICCFTACGNKGKTDLEQIKEKVLVFYDLNSGFSSTLENYLEQQENPAPEITAPEGTGDKNTLYDENGNPADFSSLFD